MKTLFTPSVFILTFFSLSMLNAQSWEEQAIGILPLNYGVYDVSVVDENIVWAVAYDQTIGNTIPFDHVVVVLKTVDGGESWESIDLDEAIGRISFDIEALDENTAFVATLDFGSGSGQGVFKTENGGFSWQEKYDGIAGGVWVKFFNQLEGIIINREFMATTENGGATWQVISSANIPNFQANEFTLLTSGNNSCEVIGDYIWFGTSKGRIYKSKDKGKTWEVFNTSLGSNAYITSVTFQDTLNGIALDSRDINTAFAETNDGGQTWNNISSNPGISVSNVEYIPNTDGALIAASDDNTPLSKQVSALSIDFGENWEIINNDIPFGGIEFITPNIGWTSRGIITSANQPAIYKWNQEIFVNTQEVKAPIDVALYPNPFTNEIALKSPSKLKEYRLSTLSGKIIESQKLDIAKPSFNFQNLDTGIYLLELIFEDESRTSQKIIKAY